MYSVVISIVVFDAAVGAIFHAVYFLFLLPNKEK